MVGFAGEGGRFKPRQVVGGTGGAICDLKAAPRKYLYYHDIFSVFAIKKVFIIIMMHKMTSLGKALRLGETPFLKSVCMYAIKNHRNHLFFSDPWADFNSVCFCSHSVRTRFPFTDVVLVVSCAPRAGIRLLSTVPMLSKVLRADTECLVFTLARFIAFRLHAGSQCYIASSRW